MMTIASSTRTVVKQVLQWTALAGAALIMGLAPALAEDAMSQSRGSVQRLPLDEAVSMRLACD
jgi:hypothetical protein